MPAEAGTKLWPYHIARALSSGLRGKALHAPAM